jgi:hypothetical protein
MQIEEYRERLESFTESLNRERYLHYSGQKETLETERFYSEYSDLFSRDAIQDIRTELENVPPSVERRKKSLQKLLRFALEEHLERACNLLTEEIAGYESRTTVTWHGQTLFYNQIANQLANEPLACRRRELNEMRVRLLEASNPMRKERLATLHENARTLGFPTYIDACRYINEIDYRALMSSLEKLLGTTEVRYQDAMNASFQRILGLALPDAHRCDVGRWTRMSNCDRFFKQERMLPAWHDTLEGLGIEPGRLKNLDIDLETRPQKQPRPFCAPVRVPGEIKIVVLPKGGQDDYMALLHEGGHAMHFAWTNAALPAEHRLCGDRALSEAFAFLFEHLIWNRRWLEIRIGLTGAEEFLRFQGLARVHLIRRYCGKLRYETILHGGEVSEDSPRVYSEILEQCTGLRYDSESYLEDLDDAFYAADYLRAWIFEVQLRDYLMSKFGWAWFQVRAAGQLLKEIWDTGQLYTVEALSREIGIGELDLQALSDELKAALRE